VAEQPDNLVLEILRELRAELKATREEVKTDLNSLRADVASDLLSMSEQIAGLKKETREQIVGVRRALIEYHSAVVGHGMLISDLDERVRRLERHLDLPSLDAH
jgi:hypothetical protein